MTPFDLNYLRLTLEIEKHIPGYIDAYLGPAGLQAEVNAAPKQSPAGLLNDLAQLQDTIPAGDPARQAYLQASLRAIGGTLHILNGAEISYLDEVATLYDITPRPVDETIYTTAHRELDNLLPGRGSLAERQEAHRQRYLLAPEQLMPLLALARDETQRRTAALVDLVPGESIELRIVYDKPWSAYNWYLGQGHSLVEFNNDIPINALHILSTMAHEGYPGHHTEAQLKERHLLHQRGYGEQASFLLHSPAAVIAEGIATTATEIIFPNGGEHTWNAEQLLPAAGMAFESAAAMQRLAQAQHALRSVAANAAIFYHTGQFTRDQTLDYLQTYALSSPGRAAKSFQFFTNPLFRSYIFTYTHGYDLIAAAANNRDKTPLFKQLLASQLLPSQLAAMATDGEST